MMVNFMNNNALKQEWLEKVKHTVETEFIDTYENYNSVSTNYVKTFNTLLHQAPIELQDDYDLNLVAAIHGHEKLSNLQPKFLKNIDFIFDLVKGGYDLQTIHSNYRCHKDLDLLEIFIKGGVQLYSHEYKEIIENREALLKILPLDNVVNPPNNSFIHMKYDEQNLPKYLFHTLYKKDVEVLSTYIQHHNPEYILNLREDNFKNNKRTYNTLMNNKNFLIEVFKKLHTKLHKTIEPKHFIKFYLSISENLQSDLDILHTVLSSSSSYIEHIPQFLKDDKDFMVYAIRKYNSFPIDKFSKEIRSDYDVAVAYILKKPEEKEIISQWDNYPFKTLEILNTVLEHTNNIGVLHPYFIHHKDIVLSLLKKDPKNCHLLFNMSSYYLDDLDVLALSIPHIPSLFKQSSLINESVLPQHTHLLEMAFSHCKDLSLLPEEHYSNKKTILSFLTSKDSFSLLLSANAEFIKDNFSLNELYRNDEDIIKALIDINPSYINFSPYYSADKDTVLYALSKGLVNLSCIDSSLHSNKDLMMGLGKTLSKYYYMLPYSLKNDPEIVELCISDNSDYSKVMRFCELSSDIPFHIKLIKENPSIYPEFSTLKIMIEPFILQFYLSYCQISSIKPTISNKVLKHYQVNTIGDLKSLIDTSQFVQYLDNNLIEKEDSIIRKIKI